MMWNALAEIEDSEFIPEEFDDLKKKNKNILKKNKNALKNNIPSSSLMEPSNGWNARAGISDSEFIPEEVDDSSKENKDIILEKKIPGKEKNLFENLPQSVVFEILVKVPPRYLHQNARLACKAWKGMISTDHFAAQNALQMKPKLVMQMSRSVVTNMHTPNFKVKVMEVEEEQLGYKLHNFVRLRESVRFRTSCNGLVLTSCTVIRNWRIKWVLRVMNLVTKYCVTLPDCPSGCPHQNCGVGLGFDPVTKKYKVVHVYADLFGFEIFTLGDSENAWKRVCAPWKQASERPFIGDFHWGDPILINEQFLHWYVGSDEYIISMDVNNETLIKTPLPRWHVEWDKYALLEFDGRLSLVYSASSTQIDVWILEDFHGQAWFMKHKILAELTTFTTSCDSFSSFRKYKNAVPKLDQLLPLASARRGEVLMFKHKTSSSDIRFYLYDAKQREMKKFKKRIRNVSFFLHRSTLFHWKTLGVP